MTEPTADLAREEGPHRLTDEEVTRRLAEPHGVWTRAAAVALIGRRRVDQLAATSWVAPWPGVLARADVPLDRVTAAKAALLASGGIAPRRTASGTLIVAAVLCGRSALRWYELPLIDDADPATGGDEARIHDVHTWTRQRDLVAPTQDGAPRELRRHRLTLAKGELWRSTSDVWVLSPARALFDGARLLTLEALVCAIDSALPRAVHPRRARADGASAPGPRGCAALPAGARARRRPGRVERRVPDPPPRAASAPAAPPQVTVVDEQGRVVARLDLGDEEALFAIEFDGKLAHAGGAMVARDRRRDRSTARFGWWTERVTWFDVRCRGEATLASVVEEHRRWSEVTQWRRHDTSPR